MQRERVESKPKFLTAWKQKSKIYKISAEEAANYRNR